VPTLRLCSAWLRDRRFRTRRSGRPDRPQQRPVDFGNRHAGLRRRSGIVAAIGSVERTHALVLRKICLIVELLPDSRTKFSVWMNASTASSCHAFGKLDTPSMKIAQPQCKTQPRLDHRCNRARSRHLIAGNLDWSHGQARRVSKLLNQRLTTGGIVNERAIRTPLRHDLGDCHLQAWKLRTVAPDVQDEISDLGNSA
jgi:hypothetical protein